MYTISSAIKDTKIKTLKRYHYTLRCMFLKRPTITSVVEDMKKQSYIYVAWYKLI